MKHNIILTKSDKSAKGTVHLTGSKSECNRALIIEALSNDKVIVVIISDAADAVLLAGILRSNKRLAVSGNNSESENPVPEINIGPAGTAMRFLTAFLPLQDEEVILT